MSVFGIASFWFGSAIFLLSQASKFFELSGDATIPVPVSANRPRLLARDFASPIAFNFMLLLFIGMSFVIYALLCTTTPTVFQGLIKISGGSVDDRLLSPTNLPLYIAGALIGLTQPIPGLEKITSTQKDLFHYWIGVPDRVRYTSDYFYTQLILKRGKKGNPNCIIDTLLSDAFRANLANKIDFLYYKKKLEDAELDRNTELDQIKEGSEREKKSVLRYLVFCVCLAAVKQGGGKNLIFVAKELGVGMPPVRTGRISAAVLSFMLLAIVLWLLIPLIKPLVDAAGLSAVPDFWPGDLSGTSSLIAVHVAPIFLSALAADLFASHRFSVGAIEPRIDVKEIFHSSASLLIGIIICIVLFDTVQALFDRGFFNADVQVPAGDFIAKRIPLFIAHAVISAGVAFFIIAYKVRAPGQKSETLFWCFCLTAFTSLLALCLGYARVKLLFRLSDAGADLIFLTVILNTAAAMSAFSVFALGGRESNTPAGCQAA